MTNKIDQLLVEYGVFEMTEQGKILCTLTKHELPYRLEDLQNYVKTKNFLREYGKKEVLDQYGEYFEDIGRGLYGCKLTMRTIATDGKSLKNHVNGPKFKNALKKALDKKAEEAKENVVDEKMETSDAEPVKAVEKQKPKESGDAEEEMAPKSGEKRKKTSGTRRATTKKTRKA